VYACTVYISGLIATDAVIAVAAFAHTTALITSPPPPLHFDGHFTSKPGLPCSLSHRSPPVQVGNLCE